MSAGVHSASGNKRGRWALSFADLALLLLGFFVLLQASGNHGKAVIEGVNAEFGAAKKTAAAEARPQVEELRAGDLFERGEAVLTQAGIDKLTLIAKSLGKGSKNIAIGSSGVDGGTLRFDAWDLAAARIGAVARQLKAAGIANGSIDIRMAEIHGGGKSTGQRITVATE